MLIVASCSSDLLAISLTNAREHAHDSCRDIHGEWVMKASEREMSKPQRKPTNLSIDRQLLEEARELQVNLSRAAENGLMLAVAEVKAKRWRESNAAALQSSNDYVEKHGLPLEKYRQF